MHIGKQIILYLVFAIISYVVTFIIFRTSILYLVGDIKKVSLIPASIILTWALTAFPLVIFYLFIGIGLQTIVRKWSILSSIIVVLISTVCVSWIFRDSFTDFPFVAILLPLSTFILGVISILVPALIVWLIERRQNLSQIDVFD